MTRIMGGGGPKKKNELPVLNSGYKIAVSNLEKAELLVQISKEVHSSDNLSEEARQCRNKTLMEFPNILKKNKMSENPIDLPLNMFELRRAIISARQTTPGKDGVCYKMSAHMTNTTLEIVLKLFNQI